MKSLSKNSGFTLLELLVVVGIVGILATISVSLFDEYRRKANDAVAISQVHDALTAHAGFKVDNENQICDFTINSDHTVTYGGGSRTMEDCFPGFVHANDVVLSFQQYDNGSGGFDDSGYHAAALHCFGSYDDSGPSHFVVLDQVRDGAYRTPELTRVSMDFLSNIPHYAAGLQHRCYAGDGFGSGGGGGADSGSDSADEGFSMSSGNCEAEPGSTTYQISNGFCCAMYDCVGGGGQGHACGVSMSNCEGGGDTGAGDTGCRR
jgi:prepilin-type N-terminal cleavage/methylation domain-containing protein